MSILHLHNDEIEEAVFGIHDTELFNAVALQLFHLQYKKNLLYRQFCHLLGKNPNNVHTPESIPFLPIRFFKSYQIVCEGITESHPARFTSSGTSGSVPSTHFVSDTGIYFHSFLKCFNRFYGCPSDYVILALLPSYLERSGSSLVYMTERLIQLGGHPDSGFYLHNHDELSKKITSLENAGKKYLLLGVSFALLDFAEKFSVKVNHGIIMETGGMKGRKEEITRNELHEKLKKSFGLEKIHSEYGMTELLSQAYAKGEGKFNCPPWMKILITSINDPGELPNTGRGGRINVIDLANMHSCCFIATDDSGKMNEDGSFEILGRIDHSDIRGCSLMTS